MGRAHLRYTVHSGGPVIRDALVRVYEKGTTTPVDDMYAASTGGATIATLTSNAQGEVEAWLDQPRYVDVKVTDNGNTAYHALAPGLPLDFAEFTETVEAAPSMDEGPLHAEWFGVKTDGTDTLVALTAALTEAIGLGRRLVLPPGDMFIDDGTLITAAIEDAKLRMDGVGARWSRIVQAPVEADALAINLTGAAVVDLRDFGIVGPTGIGASSGTHAIEWVGGVDRYFHMKRVAVTGEHDHAALISGQGVGEVNDCDLESTVVSVACFESTDTAGSASFFARGGRWSTPLATRSPTSVGLYRHPHIPGHVEGVIFDGYGRYASYENGNPGSARTPFTMALCDVIDADLAQTKTTGLSQFIGIANQGQGSAGTGSHLGGKVLISGGVYDRAVLSAGALVSSDVTIGGGAILKDTRLVTAGNAAYRWHLKASTIYVTDEVPAGMLIRFGAGRTVFDDVDVYDDSTTADYQAILGLTQGASHVKLNNVRGKECRGTLGWLYMDQPAATLKLVNSELDGSGVTLNITGEASAGSITEALNDLRNGAGFIGAGAAAARVSAGLYDV